MAIARPKRPVVLVTGHVLSVTPRTSSKSGEVYRHDVTLESPEGGVLAVEFWDRDDSSIPLPAVLAPVALVAEVSESAQYGASLSALRYVTPDDLDRMASAAGLLAGAK